MLSNKNTVALICALLLLASVAPAAYPQSIADIVARAKPAVVVVFSRLPGGVLSMGSGFVADTNGFIPTAHHIFDKGGTPGVIVPGFAAAAASIAALDRNADVAILRVSQSGLRTIPIGDSSALRQGEEILVLGYPRVDALGVSDSTVTRGIVSSVRSDLIQIDASVNPGNSGGPVLNMRGEVVGIAVAGLRGSTGINFAVPINTVKPLLVTAIGSPGVSAPPTAVSQPTTAARPSLTTQAECRSQGTSEQPGAGNELTNCVAEQTTPSRIRLTVTYSYSQAQGIQNIWLGADIIAAGNRLKWFGYRPAPILAGAGTASIEIVYGLNNPPSARVTTDQVEFFMYVGGGQVFYRKIFSLAVDWQL